MRLGRVEQIQHVRTSLYRVVSYGSLGTIVGHEVMHAFDPKGIGYDAYGREEQWMKARAQEYYRNASYCIVQFFNKFAEENTTVRV